VAISFKSVGDLSTDRKFQEVPNETPIGLQTPLRLGTKSDGIFAMHFDIANQIQDNFRNLLLTNYGERLGLFDFGANLRALTLELAAEEFEAEVSQRIKQATSRFMPFIDLQTFEYQVDRTQNEATAQILLRIIYNVPSLGVQNRGLELTFFLAG